MVTVVTVVTVVTMHPLATLLVLLLWEITAASQSEFDAFSSDQCFLTPNLGNIGTRKFLEECEEIGEIFFFILSLKTFQYF